MNIKFFNLLIVAGIAALCGYGLFLLNQEKDLWQVLTFVPSVLVFITLSASLCIEMNDKKSLYGIRSLSIVFLILFAILGIVFSVVDSFYQGVFIITHGMLILLYALLIKVVVSKKK